MVNQAAEDSANTLCKSCAFSLAREWLIFCQEPLERLRSRFEIRSGGQKVLTAETEIQCAMADEPDRPHSTRRLSRRAVLRLSAILSFPALSGCGFGYGVGEASDWVITLKQVDNSSVNGAAIKYQSLSENESVIVDRALNSGGHPSRPRKRRIDDGRYAVSPGRDMTAGLADGFTGLREEVEAVTGGSEPYAHLLYNGTYYRIGLRLGDVIIVRTEYSETDQTS